MILDIQFKNYRSFKDKCSFSMEASSTETKANNVFVAPVSENDEEKISALMNFYAKTYKIIGLVIIAIGLILTPFLKYLIKDNKKGGAAGCYSR